MNAVALILSAGAWALTDPAPVTRLYSPGRSQGSSARKLLIPFGISLATLAVMMADRAALVLAAVIAAGSALLLAGRLLRLRTHRRELSHTAQFLDHVLADLSAGAQPEAALCRAAEELPPGSARTTCMHAAAHAAWANNPAAVLKGAEVEELARVGAAWEVGTHHGIALTSILSDRRDHLHARLRADAAMTAALQGPQASALILSLLPVAGILLGTGMGANPLQVLINTPLGNLLLILGVTLNSAGVLSSQLIMERARS